MSIPAQRSVDNATRITELHIRHDRALGRCPIEGRRADGFRVLASDPSGRPRASQLAVVYRTRSAIALQCSVGRYVERGREHLDRNILLVITAARSFFGRSGTADRQSQSVWAMSVQYSTPRLAFLCPGPLRWIKDLQSSRAPELQSSRAPELQETSDVATREPTIESIGADAAEAQVLTGPSARWWKPSRSSCR